VNFLEWNSADLLPVELPNSGYDLSF
jgi:hypothetical protein